MGIRTLAALITAGALLLTTGCGSGTSPADDVPALSTALTRVDQAIAAEEHDEARDAVAELMDVATKAEETGDLDADQVDRIVSAAETLLAALPGAETPTPEPEPSAPTPEAETPTPTPAGPEHGEKPEKEPKEPKGPKNSKDEKKD